MDELKGLGFKGTIIRGLKKLAFEITSLKFWGLAFIGFLTYQQIIDGMVGVAAMLALLGIREVSGVMFAKLKGNGANGANGGDDVKSNV